MNSIIEDFPAGDKWVEGQCQSAGGEHINWGHGEVGAQGVGAPVLFLDGSQTPADAHRSVAVVENAPAAIAVSTPSASMERPSRGPQTGPDQSCTDPHSRRARATGTPDGHTTPDTQSVYAVGGSTPPAPASAQAQPVDPSLGLADPLLALLADALDDLERTRIASENRLRQMTRDQTDADGEQRGLGLPVDQPEVARLAAVVEGLAALEHQAELTLKRRLRAHPLGGWVKATIGVGEKQGARLLAAIGDPYWNSLHGRPRTVSELWAFSGYRVIELPAADHRGIDAHTPYVGGGSKPGGPDHTSRDSQSGAVGVAQTRVKGQRANWSGTAKKRAFLVAESCIKQAHSPYRKVYDEGRVQYADAVHQVACRRCGPAGKPAEAGSPLSLGHQHARARRLVAKAVLKDLWIAARQVHLDAEDGTP